MAADDQPNPEAGGTTHAGTRAFASAMSEHPDPAQATGEAVGQVLDAVGPAPEVCLLFVTGPHVEAVEDIVATVQAALRPRSLLGASAVSVIGGRREVEDQAAVAVWAARHLPARPVRMEAVRTPDGVSVVGFDPDVLAGAPGATFIVLADPMSFPMDDVLTSLGRDHRNLNLIGGMASASFQPGGNRLVLDDEVHRSGLVGLLLPPDAGITTVVSQGCRPIGDPFTVTAAEANVIFEMGGAPALDRLVSVLETLPDSERALAQSGLHLGRVIDEHKLDFGRGDFLVRNLAGVDQSRRSVVVNDHIEIGATVQFQVRDAAAADEDLHLMLSPHRADAALVFTCNGRGTRLFGRPDHDAEVVAETTGVTASAGMFCAGEIGPVGGRSFLHGFTASVALLG